MKGNVIRNLVFGSTAVAGVFLMAQTASAAIGGRCDNCHTMHNSQDGASMVSTGTGVNPAQAYLLMYNCTGCHSRGDGTSAVNASTSAPAVQHTGSAPGTSPGTNYFNAGGSFYWVTNTGDAYGHNVDEVTTGDVALGNVPPGDTAGNYNTAAQITCVDTSGNTSLTGCHYGGGHHANTGGDYLGYGATTTSWVDGTTVGSSYRFLSGNTLGGEDSDWEWTNDKNDHNIYAGVDAIAGADGTITGVCIRCHGDFHGTYASDLGTGSGPSNPWYRHPTDIGLLSSGVDSEHASYGSYDPITPIAQDVGTIPTTGDATIEGTWSGVTATFDNVTCVSCHRAHGSSSPDMLRWSYVTMDAGAGAVSPPGCFKCHTDKD